MSLGTGRPSTPKSPPSNSYVRLVTDITDAMTNTEDSWAKFVAATSQKHGIFRLNPIYKGIGFEFDDCRKLDEIENQTDAWLDTCDTHLTSICDQLIAALFYFAPKGPINDGVQFGQILCRLPVNLSARQNLFDGMRQEQDMELFSIQFVGRPRLITKIDVADSLAGISPEDELQIPVEIHDLPAMGDIVIQIMMRGLRDGRSGSPASGSPISGSPYVLREEQQITPQTLRGTM